MDCNSWLLALGLIIAINTTTPLVDPFSNSGADAMLESSNSLSTMRSFHQDSMRSGSMALPDRTLSGIDSSEEVSPCSKAALIASVAGFNYWYYKRLKPVWWDGDGAHFHFINDWYRNYALEQDKFSHFFAAQFMARQWATICENLGWPTERAYFWGAICALTTETGTEVLDGFTRRFGFSFPDYLADIGGAFFPYFQQKYPALQHIKMKMSYRASPFYLGGGTDLFEDYDGMTFWWSFNIRQLLPVRIKKYYPYFLWVAVGYGVDRVWIGPHRTRQLYLALDYNFSNARIRNRLIRYLLNLLDLVHLGAPTLQLYPFFKNYGYFY
ncbi:MAG: YfiM family protein [candidate division KSB1 bacterium]|nr:YfiM family protein [candidate division KSB1 bacterium]MDZ7335733.1 YfiM family protein [candidate division KSB1 bacterium]MDZ7357916.1 YfiM family protein [candidate division KSB1 bacterium]MDZ7401616.1 YfiM family protein [candidate division KSB1 bacterium]